MNTTLIGDDFEERCYNAIMIAINEEILGISPDSARVFKKKGYYSSKRDKHIIIDIAIEIWPPKAERPSVIYLIECKDYSKRIPVDDVEEFNSKITQIADGRFFIKGVFIASTSFQEGALTLGKNLGFMMIELDSSNNLSIKFHKKERSLKYQVIPHEELDAKVESFLKKTLLFKNEELSRLSKVKISNKAIDLLNEFDPKVLSHGRRILIEKLISFFEIKYEVKFNLKAKIDPRMLGFYDPKINEIQVNISLEHTKRQAFVIAHEMGHFLLHRRVKVDQDYYDSFSDSVYNIETDKHDLVNFRHWIEWQANYFATSLLLPRDMFRCQLAVFQKNQGISKLGYIYLDDQRVNIEDYLNALTHLSDYFNTSKTSVIYRLEELGLIIYAKEKKSFHAHVRNLLFQLDGDQGEIRARILENYSHTESVDSILYRFM